jgi:hypothetical protein
MSDLSVAMETEVEIPQGFGLDGEVRCEFITGIAGSGKTHECRRRIEGDEGYGVLCATTGIAAVNLGVGVMTLNSLLRFYKTQSLEDAFASKRLHFVLSCLALDEGYRNLIIDEVSMLDGRQLDLIYNALEDNCQFGRTLGLILTGDFCQLPPVEGPFAFDARCWPKFEENTTRLTKCWRHDEVRFLESLNALRAGEGGRAAEILQGTAVEFAGGLDEEFDGSTVMATNKAVDLFNEKRLAKLPGKAFRLNSLRWCAPDRPEILGQWKDIPRESWFKENALVMLLVNDTQEWSHVNGDLGHVIGIETATRTVLVQLLRNQMVVKVKPMWRLCTQRERPGRYKEVKWADWPRSVDEARERTAEDYTYYDEGNKRWVLGGCYYFPIRLAWATTVHKSQGLTLDRLQVDLRHSFLGSAAMAYVALSRCRTSGGLRLVGTPGLLARQCRSDKRCSRWL